MKIAFITPEYVTESYFAGGLANYLGRISESLCERGHEVHVFTKSFAADESIQHRGVTVHRVVPWWQKSRIADRMDPWVPKRLYYPYQDVKCAWALWRRWRKQHAVDAFDIVQVANVLSVGLFFRHERSVPIVTRMSSFRPDWTNAIACGPSIASNVRTVLEKFAVKGTSFHYAPSTYVAERVQKAYSLGAVPVIETPFFIEEPHMDTSLYEEIGHGAPYILYFGRMNQMKGPQILSHALQAILPHHAEHRAIFIGDDGMAPDGGSMQSYVRQQLAAWSERVIIRDAVRHDLLYPILKNASVVVVPSLVDNLPNTCLEAMGLAKIVVATTGSCFEQIIEDGRNGFLSEANNPTALASSISRALALSGSEQRSMGDAAERRISQLHPDVIVPQVVEFFNEVCSA